MTDVLLFTVFPYLALILAVVVGFVRYFSDRFSYTSHSSQFFESRQLFWGSVPWHYGILLILGAHLVAVVFPSWWGSVLSDTSRLYVLEITGFGLAIFTVLGLIILITRKFTSIRVRTVTTGTDWILLLVLFVQVVTGLYIALVYRWGGMWYVQTAAPWLKSLVFLNPQIQSITVLPWMVKLHFVNAFVLLAILPFTRLVHLLSFPLSYLWRPYLVVRWNRKKPVGSVQWALRRTINWVKEKASSKIKNLKLPA